MDATLRRLEAEAVHILRETAAVFRAPVLLYSIGKDSSALLHLAGKAFAPATAPFRLLHVNTTWKFREMLAHRDLAVARAGLPLTVHVNAEGLASGVTPFDADRARYTRVMKTEALRQALDTLGADAAIGGARRDEAPSRAKERIFSLRRPGHVWEPGAQRPELWRVFNTRLGPGETMRVFPLSNWTELDVWRYIRAEGIAVPDLYFARERPVVEREGVPIMVDDDRFPLRPGERPETRRVRFRTLGCYPLTGAIASDAATLDAVIAELERDRLSERAGRVIDRDPGAGLEGKKREGYF